MEAQHAKISLKEADPRAKIKSLKEIILLLPGKKKKNSANSHLRSKLSARPSCPSGISETSNLNPITLSLAPSWPKSITLTSLLMPSRQTESLIEMSLSLHNFPLPPWFSIHSTLRLLYSSLHLQWLYFPVERGVICWGPHTVYHCVTTEWFVAVSKVLRSPCRRSWRQHRPHLLCLTCSAYPTCIKGSVSCPLWGGLHTMREGC